MDHMAEKPKTQVVSFPCIFWEDGLSHQEGMVLFIET